MNKQLTNTLQSKIESFRDALSGARQNLITAGKLLVEMLDENEDAFEILVAQKVATLPMLESLERVGRGQLDPALLTDVSPAAQRAIAKALPPQAQKQLLTGFVPVAVQDNGGFKVEQMRMADLSQHQAARVIGDGVIRTVEAQCEIIKEQLATRAAHSLRYELRDGRIIFHEDTVFTWRELIELADKIKPRASDIEADIKRSQVARKV